MLEKKQLKDKLIQNVSCVMFLGEVILKISHIDSAVSLGTIIGEETGGVLTAYGDLIRFQLPNIKLNAFCSHKRFIHPCNDDQVHGVKPDIEIGPTLEDIQNGRDTVIEFVKSSIAKSH